MRGEDYYVLDMSSCLLSVPMCCANTSIFSLCTSTERIAMKFGEIITTTNRWIDDRTLWVKLYQGQGSRIQRRICIDVKLVLPRSECLRRLHITYDVLCPHGWQVHYTHAAAETSYDHERCLVNIHIIGISAAKLVWFSRSRLMSFESADVKLPFPINVMYGC